MIRDIMGDGSVSFGTFFAELVFGALYGIYEVKVLRARGGCLWRQMPTKDVASYEKPR